jgi:purine catabolism regulator
VVARLHAGSASVTHVGVSRPVRAPRLPQAYAEALASHRLGPATNAGYVHLYDDLALQRLLTPLQTGPDLANFVEAELGTLIAYDEQHNAELVHTLDAYLQCNGAKAATAELLHLQRRSVYYRLERIEALLDRSLDTPVHRVRLYVALRARELLTARPPRT